MPADPITDVKQLRWTVDLIAAGCDCRAKLAAIKALEQGRTPPASACSLDK